MRALRIPSRRNPARTWASTCRVPGVALAILVAASWLTTSTVSAGRTLALPLEGPLPSPGGPRNIILFIGDGMGDVHRTAARWVQVGTLGDLNMDSLAVSGWSRTASANSAVTDSAAGATAIATGVRTNNGWISMLPEDTVLTTILEYAREEGKAAGLVSTVEIYNATPAAFAAHRTSRYDYDEIAQQMLEEGAEVMLGGGEGKFLPTPISGCFGAGTRIDSENLVAQAVDAGYVHVCSAFELADVIPSSTPLLLGLFAGGEMIPPYTPNLATMTQRAIDILSRDPQGFFLMVEGGRIDKEAHASNGTKTINETLWLDEAVAVGKAFAASAGNTLLIVAADHETGGMGIVPGSDCSSPNGPFAIAGSSETFCVTWTTNGHTAADVPVTASGPFAHLLAGSYDNTHIFEAMDRALVLDESLFLPLLLRH